VARVKLCRAWRVCYYNVSILGNCIKTNNRLPLNAVCCVQRILAEVSAPERLIAYGSVYWQHGYHEESVRLYQKALLLSPQSRDGILELARRYKLGGEPRKAVQTLASAMRLNPNDEEVQAEIEDAFIKLNIIEETIQFYADLMNLFPDNKYICRQLSRAYVHQGGMFLVANRLKAAEEFYANAFAFDPDNQKAVEGLKTVRWYRARQKSGLKQLLMGRRHSLPRFTLEYILIKVIPFQMIGDQLVYSNLVAISKLCRKRVVPLIFSGYPHDIPEPMVPVALLYDIPLVDHRPVFERLHAFAPESSYIVSRFDTHCTAKGYGVMAENISTVVLNVVENNASPQSH
ncbi:MAG: hypothetical protein Q7U74_15820, partial [Saprospiraceae bacterium]|nr:hypothetical protein [Saprospiraceae bacterium]